MINISFTFSRDDKLDAGWARPNYHKGNKVGVMRIRLGPHSRAYRTQNLLCRFE
jgi:hypothetical protein